MQQMKKRHSYDVQTIYMIKNTVVQSCCFYKKPSSYDHKNTMRINEVKEGTLKGRAPVPESTKIASGTDKINMEVKKIEGDIINTREVAGTKVYNSLTNIDPVSVTQEKNNYDYKIMDERIEPELLDAFKNNPYTQPYHPMHTTRLIQLKY